MWSRKKGCFDYNKHTQSIDILTKRNNNRLKFLTKKKSIDLPALRGGEVVAAHFPGQQSLVGGTGLSSTLEKWNIFYLLSFTLERWLSFPLEKWEISRKIFPFKWIFFSVSNKVLLKFPQSIFVSFNPTSQSSSTLHSRSFKAEKNCWND